jgi:polar amino acid transport system substrate-binding protein
MKINLVLFIIPLFVTFLSHAQKTLTLATTHWCPYTCDFNGNKHGIVGEIMTSILHAQGINLSIEYYPWSRAIRMANQNKVDGLLTSTLKESPNLIFSTSPIGSYQMCFYSKDTNNWLYKPDLKFGSNKLAIVQDYGYGEPLDSYINENKYKNLLFMSGEDNSSRLIRMLQIGRSDIIIEDNKVIQWTMIKNNVDTSHIKQVGCLDEQPFFLALSSNEDNLELMKGLNQTLFGAYEQFNQAILIN